MSGSVSAHRVGHHITARHAASARLVPCWRPRSAPDAVGRPAGGRRAGRAARGRARGRGGGAGDADWARGRARSRARRQEAGAPGWGQGQGYYPDVCARQGSGCAARAAAWPLAPAAQPSAGLRAPREAVQPRVAAVAYAWHGNSSAAHACRAPYCQLVRRTPHARTAFSPLCAAHCKDLHLRQHRVDSANALATNPPLNPERRT